MSLLRCSASEEACGLHYNHDAIERFMTEHFKPNDDIYSDLTIMVAANKREAEETTASTWIALCAQVRRAAKHYGFIQ